MINGCLPITVDGTQKLYRDGMLQDQTWCERSVGNPEDENMQQYIYVIEANVTLKSGLSIPLMTEYLYRENNVLLEPNGKQDSETTAFERMAGRIKDYFPRQKMIFFMDARYATQSIMGLLHRHHWGYIIRLPKSKLTNFAKIINKERDFGIPIPGQTAFRKRENCFTGLTTLSTDMSGN